MGKDFQTNKYQTFLTCVFFLLAGAAYKMPDSFLAFFYHIDTRFACYFVTCPSEDSVYF